MPRPGCHLVSLVLGGNCANGSCQNHNIISNISCEAPPIDSMHCVEMNLTRRYISKPTFLDRLIPRLNQHLVHCDMRRLADCIDDRASHVFGIQDLGTGWLSILLDGLFVG